MPDSSIEFGDGFTADLENEQKVVSDAVLASRIDAMVVSAIRAIAKSPLWPQMRQDCDLFHLGFDESDVDTIHGCGSNRGELRAFLSRRTSELLLDGAKVAKYFGFSIEPVGASEPIVGVKIGSTGGLVVLEPPSGVDTSVSGVVSTDCVE